MSNKIKSYRYEPVHGDDAEYIAYQRKTGRVWRTVSVWMIPQTTFR